MLILASVVLNLTIGEKGIFNLAQKAGKDYEQAQKKELEDIDKLLAYINSETLPENNKDTEVGTYVKVPDKWKTNTPNYISTKDGATVIETKKISTVAAVATGNGETVPVPLGFYYVGGNTQTGVVISDNSVDQYDGTNDKVSHEYAPKLKGNQFVWIPCNVEAYHKIDWGKENAKWDMGTNGFEENQIRKYEGFYIGRYEAGVATLNEETNQVENSVTFANNASMFNAVPIETGYHNWTWQNYSYTARGQGIQLMQGTNNAIGNIVLRANSIPYYHSDYYTALEMTRRLYAKNQYVTSGLTTGTQWDMVMAYLQNRGVDVTSSNWGNYDNVSIENLRGYYTNVTETGITNGFKTVADLKTDAQTNSFVLLTTGSTKQVMKNNLYDIAGNLVEWTTETAYVDNQDYNMDSTYNSYILRGGCFSNAYASFPACSRSYTCAVDAGTFAGFRPVLYMK